MERKGLSHEGLKLIACMTMLLDHIGIIAQLRWLRIIGRLAFPIYCFLLAQGARHTRNPKRYALRLLICGLISEIPFDLFCRQGWGSQNVMFTLFLGFGMIWAAGQLRNLAGKLMLAAICAVAAELLKVDYGATGILMIAVFAWTESGWLQAVLLLMACFTKGISIQICAVAAMIPILLYSGRSGQTVVQYNGGSICFTRCICCCFTGSGMYKM